MYCWMNSGDIVGSIHGLLHKFIPHWNNVLCICIDTQKINSGKMWVVV